MKTLTTRADSGIDPLRTIETVAKTETPAFVYHRSQPLKNTYNSRFILLVLSFAALLGLILVVAL
jgi:hypothetical protein